jgi:hypothetical protein
LWGNQIGITEQGNGPDEEIVQVMDGDVSCARVVDLYGYRLLVGVGMATKGGQEVTHAALCRKVTVEEAETLGIIRIAWMLQVA